MALTTSRSRLACFFFSSRRRHTRFKCDWSSDVCSSDLLAARSTAHSTAHLQRSKCGGPGNGLQHMVVRLPVLVRHGAGLGKALQPGRARSEEHTSELQSHLNLVCRLLLEKKKKTKIT